MDLHASLGYKFWKDGQVQSKAHSRPHDDWVYDQADSGNFKALPLTSHDYNFELGPYVPITRLVRSNSESTERGRLIGKWLTS